MIILRLCHQIAVFQRLFQPGGDCGFPTSGSPHRPALLLCCRASSTVSVGVISCGSGGTNRSRNLFLQPTNDRAVLMSPSPMASICYLDGSPPRTLSESFINNLVESLTHPETQADICSILMSKTRLMKNATNEFSTNCRHIKVSALSIIA